MWVNANVMAALRNIGGALCSKRTKKKKEEER